VVVGLIMPQNDQSLPATEMQNISGLELSYKSVTPFFCFAVVNKLNENDYFSTIYFSR